MLPLILLTLVGLGATAFIFDDIFNDDDAAAPEGEGEGENPEGETAQNIITGTLLSDMLSDDDLEDDTERVEGLAGDDILNFATSGLEIDGGEGNDEITVGSDSETLTDLDLTGGEGDDTITASDVTATALDGGDGNDMLTLEQMPFDGASANSVAGGAGDDEIAIDLTFSAEATPAVEAAGGAGADTFTVGLTPDFAEGSNDAANADELVQITDFSPAEDQLVIDLSNADVADNLDRIETRLEQTGANYELIITFLTESGDELNGVIDLGTPLIPPGTQGSDFISILWPDGFNPVPIS